MRSAVSVGYGIPECKIYTQFRKFLSDAIQRCLTDQPNWFYWRSLLCKSKHKKDVSHPQKLHTNGLLFPEGLAPSIVPHHQWTLWDPQPP